MIEVQIFPLVAHVATPMPAPAVARAQIPKGYGVQEHCLPFTAATALGFLIPSPIAFGICPPRELPPNCHQFRSPIDRTSIDGSFEDAPVFYVKDDRRCSFANNAFKCESIEIVDPKGKFSFSPIQPGISFFDREDQRDLFKLHLPYIWRTPPEVDALFLPAVNRPDTGFMPLSGLVETDWYATTVNLVLRKPLPDHSVHIMGGDPIAQVIFVARSHRQSALTVVASHARLAREFRAASAEWFGQRAKDRSAYKKLARSHEGCVESGTTMSPISQASRMSHPACGDGNNHS